MSGFDEMIQAIKNSDFQEKNQFLQYLVRMTGRGGHQLAREDRDALLEYAYWEVDNLRRVIPETESYKEKDPMLLCGNFILGLLMDLCKSPSQIPQEKMVKINALAEMVKKERYIENALDDVFAQSVITKTDINRLLYWARQTTDEYQRGKLFEGLAYYQKEYSKLDSGANQAIAAYIASEIRRLMALNCEDAWNVLELIADVCKHFMNEDITAALMDLLQLSRNHINVCALDTLCGMGLDVPQPVIEALARDLEFAFLAYHILQRQGKTALFPAECATEEYLAKSDLVHWLCFPTELGKAPDAIEYIGKVKYFFKKEVFYVFKYRSDSENLNEEQKNKWLIGWSSEDGGTFSNFDEYAPFEQATTEKTLRLIKKKLIG